MINQFLEEMMQIFVNAAGSPSSDGYCSESFHPSAPLARLLNSFKKVDRCKKKPFIAVSPAKITKNLLATLIVPPKLSERLLFSCYGTIYATIPACFCIVIIVNIILHFMYKTTVQF